MWGLEKIIRLYVAGTYVLLNRYFIGWSRVESLTLSDLKKTEVLKLA